jgi:hypothetical protein
VVLPLESVVICIRDPHASSRTWTESSAPLRLSNKKEFWKVTYAQQVSITGRNSINWRLYWTVKIHFMKRPLPVTSCTACGNAGYNPTLVDGRCGKNIDGERCKGTNSSATSDGDWQECVPCQAIGVERNAHACSAGVGWQLARKTRLNY